MEEITTEIKKCPICDTEWDFFYYDAVYYFKCEKCETYFESYNGKTLNNQLDIEPE